MNRSRQRSPNLSAWDRILAGWMALLVPPTRLLRSAIVLSMAWPKSLNAAGIIEKLKQKIASLQQQWRRETLPAHPNPVVRRPLPELLKMMLEELRLIDEQIGQLDQEMANLLSHHQDAVQRLAEVPGLGVDSAQQIIAEVGAPAATFPSAKQLSSWVGACPGDNESAGVNYSHRSPKGNRNMRRLLNQTANAAVKAKGTIFEMYIVVRYRGSDTNRLSGRLPIGSVVSSGRSSTREFVTKNVALLSAKRASKPALRE